MWQPGELKVFNSLRLSIVVTQVDLKTEVIMSLVV